MNKEKIYFDKIQSETGIITREIKKLVDEKKEELKGLISTEGALYIIGKELGVL